LSRAFEGARRLPAVRRERHALRGRPADVTDDAAAVTVELTAVPVPTSSAATGLAAPFDAAEGHFPRQPGPMSPRADPCVADMSSHQVLSAPEVGYKPSSDTSP
jgi:hypothetical protein